MVKIIDESNFETVILIGPRFGSVMCPKHFLSFSSAAEACRWFVSNPVQGKTILVKGSRGMHLEEILKAL